MPAHRKEFDARSFYRSNRHRLVEAVHQPVLERLVRILTAGLRMTECHVVGGGSGIEANTSSMVLHEDISAFHTKGIAILLSPGHIRRPPGLS